MNIQGETDTKRPYRLWTEFEISELRRLWPSPLRRKEIAFRLRRHPNTVWSKAQELGLRRANDAAGSSKPGRVAEARHDDLPQQVGSAASAPPSPDTFDGWWAGEKARMRWAKIAAPRGSKAQGRPYHSEQFGRVLARSLAEESST